MMEIVSRQEKTIKIKVGQTYELDDSVSTYLSADIHLDCEDGSWLEIGKETLEECFEEVDVDEWKQLEQHI